MRIELAQHLDEQSIERFEREFGGIARECEVEIVFPAMLDLDDRVFARVARALVERAAHVTVRGAYRHHERVLEYMGVRIARDNPAARRNERAG